MENMSMFSPQNSGSMYFNFKKSCSIDLKAVADEHYTKFIAVDVGGFGKQSDGGTLQASEQYRVLTK